ncbi:VOC family protein [Devosia sp.]|uniref:VOC family protein n=1 Tax=Devosia sp. TaxID=1871048 RepID=UPI0035ADE3E7
MPKIMPCLWIDDRIEEMVNFYVATFGDAEIRDTQRYPDGRVLTMTFRLRDQEFMALNCGARFPFTEAVSFSVDCKDQAEVDYFWAALTADGGAESMCGWCRDRFGLSWQIVPQRLVELVWDSTDKAAGARAQQAMFQMRKIVIADLEKAHAGL